MEVDEEEGQLGGIASLGISRILAAEGVDVSSFSNVLDKQGAESARKFAEVEADDDNDDKYEDDLSDNDLPAESAQQREEREADDRRRRAEEDRWYRRAMQMQQDDAASRAATAAGSRIGGRDDDGQASSAASKVKTELDQIREVWPGFSTGKRLKMSEIMYETPRDTQEYLASLDHTKRRRLEARHVFRPEVRIPSHLLLAQPNLEELLLPDTRRPFYEGPLGYLVDPTWVKEAKHRLRKEMTRPPEGFNPDSVRNMRISPGGARHEVSPDEDFSNAMSLDLGDWESNIVWCPFEAPQAEAPTPTVLPHNTLLDSGDWIGQVIWDSTLVTPDLIESDDEQETPTSRVEVKPSKQITGGGASSSSRAHAKLDPFNLSNDHIYEQSKEARHRIRQTFGAIEVFHAGPARALQMPFYKTTLSKPEARAWHRPALHFPVGVNLSFSKLRSKPMASSSSRKKQMLTDPSELFKSTKDLSMSEKGPCVLLEFSEEYPPIMSGYGMGTTMVNYYRKKNEQDEFVPKLDFGQPAILNPGDAEPFLLAFVKSGETVPVIHNNLIRAPIFKHQPPTTDFLVVRQTINGHASYYIRSIQNLYTVGQTVPNESEIPGPHARKNTTYARIRLQIVAWLLIEKNKQKRLKMSKLLKYFPEQTELQMRQRLKIKGNEFLVYHRQQGPNQGYWQLNSKLPDEKDGRPWPSKREEVLEMATPEQASLYEAMQVGARHLHDAGYSKTAEGKDEDGDYNDEAGLDIEQRLAVWYTTLNYKKAEQQKAWLVVHGEGDPTGRGEGVSFLKTNMKGYFLRKGETEQGRRLEAEAKSSNQVVKISNAEQSRIYEEEKRRVWELQQRALSSTQPPQPDMDDEYRMAPTPAAGIGPRFSRADGRSAGGGGQRAFSRSGSMVATPLYGESPREYSPAPSADESVFTGHGVANKVLRIKRVVKGKTHYEIVRDPAVIASYRRRVEDRKIEAYKSQVDMLAPTGNLEEDELRRAALLQELENTRKNQARRKARDKYKRRVLLDEKDIDPSKRKCGACGAVGHTKANRACPMYEESVKKGVVAPSPSAAATPAQTPGGIGMAGGMAGVGGGYGSAAPTPMGGAGYGTDYFSGGGSGDGPAQTPSTQIKIRLGGPKP